MNWEQSIASLGQRINANPDDASAKIELSKLLLPEILAHWPAGLATLNTAAYSHFLNNLAIPAARILEGLNTLDFADFLFQIVSGLHWIGEQDQAEVYVKKALEIRTQIAQNHPLRNKNIVFLQTRTGTLTQFGHLMVEPDYFIKSGKLGKRPPLTGIMLVPNGKCINPALLRYWRREICVITDAELCNRLKGLERTLEHSTYWLEVPGVGIRYGHSGVLETFGQWEREKRPPNIKLDPRHLEAGWKYLENLGISRNSWFVTAHVRYSVTHEMDQVAIRNAELDTYLDAYREVVKRGGYVIRIGDKQMPKMPAIDGVFDLAHLESRPDWLDLFLGAQCEFFLGSASGPCSLAPLFQRPLIMSNIPTNCFTISESDVFLPKLLREIKTGRLLSFRETFVSKYQYVFNGGVYREWGLEWVDNEPDDLVNAVIEMIERQNGTIQYSEDDLYLASRFDTYASTLEGRNMKCRLARDFARKHRNLIIE